jgi:hypothetical protein
MPQSDAIRIQYEVCKDITSTANDDIQTLTDTTLLCTGDTVNFYEKDASGCIDWNNLLGQRTISGICTNASVVVDSPIDLSSLTAGSTPVMCVVDLDNVQKAGDRQDDYTQPETYKYRIQPAITGSEYDVPIIGQARHQVAECAFLFQAGDSYQIICDSGVVASGLVISSDAGNEKVVIDDNTDLTAETGCKLINTSLTLAEHLKRLKTAVLGGIPVYHDDLGKGDCDHTAFEVSSIFLPGTTRVKLDGNEPNLGTCGTVATLDHGTFPGNDDALRFTSLVTGKHGNTRFQVEIIASAGTAVTVTGSWENSDILISIDNDNGAATAATLAAALTADPDASRYFHVQYGGDGTGFPAALAATNLAGGLDDYTGQYCEIEQLEANVITGTGFKWVSLHIDPDDVNLANPNNMQEPPRTSECVFAHYDKS